MSNNPFEDSTNPFDEVFINDSEIVPTKVSSGFRMEEEKNGANETPIETPKFTHFNNNELRFD